MRRVRAALAATFAFPLLTLGVNAVTVTAAHASPGDLTCTENDSATYSPGLLNTPQTVNVTVHNTLNCLSLSDPTLTSGTLSLSVHGLTRSCTDLLASTTGHYTLRWNNGNTSTISYSITANYANGTLVVTEKGTVTAGEFTGDGSLHIATEPGLDLTVCNSAPGLTHANGTGTTDFS